MHYVVNDLPRVNVPADRITADMVGKVLVNVQGWGYWYLLLGVRPDLGPGGGGPVACGIVTVAGIWEGLDPTLPVEIRELPRCRHCGLTLTPAMDQWLTYTPDGDETNVCPEDEHNGPHDPALPRTREITFQPYVTVTVTDGKVAEVRVEWSESRVNEEDDDVLDRVAEAEVAEHWLDDPARREQVATALMRDWF